MYDTLRFWTMSCADLLDEYFESEIVKAHLAGSSIIGTALGPRSPGTAYVLLHHYMGSIDGAVGRLGFCPRRHGRDHAGAGRLVRRQAAALSAAAPRWSRSWCAAAAPRAWCSTTARSSQRRIVVSNLDVKRTFLETMAPEHLPPEFVEQVRNFKIRGSSGKLNIALDGLPHFPAIPHGSPCMRGDLHVTDTHRDARARLRRLEGGPLVARALRRHADPVADRSHHGARWQALHVGVRAVLSLPARRRRMDAREAPGVRRTVIDAIAAHSPDFKDLILHAEIRTPLGHRERGRTDRGQHLPGRAHLRSAAVQPSGARLRAVPRAGARHVHVRLEHAPGRRRHGRPGCQRRARHSARPRAQPVNAAGSTHYDCIVIGGGHNGLVCAAYLARGGRRVLVLEAAEPRGRRRRHARVRAGLQGFRLRPPAASDAAGADAGAAPRGARP